MAKRFLRPFVITYKPLLGINSTCNIRKLHTTDEITKEVKIPVQWGHVSAKLWGNENEQPILALHGWQDNAGTWDTLAPLLYKQRPILAIDFPGHGFSSWYPPGMAYYPWDYTRLILTIKKYFKWNKISLLSHSMGSIATLRFAAMFPDDVSFYIAIDTLVAEDYDLNRVIETYPKTMQKMQLAQTRLEEEPPSYTFEEMENIWHRGTMKSVALENVKYLLKRGSKPSSRDPNKFYFSRDLRVKHGWFNPEEKSFIAAQVKRLACPILYIKGLNSPYELDEFSLEMRELVKNNNPNFECHFLPGTHHLHLNNPEKVADLILAFYEKHNLVK